MADSWDLVQAAQSVVNRQLGYFGSCRLAGQLSPWALPAGMSSHGILGGLRLAFRLLAEVSRTRSCLLARVDLPFTNM